MQRQPPRMIHQVDRDRRVNAVAQRAPAAHPLQLGQDLAADAPTQHQIQLEDRQLHQIDRLCLGCIERVPERLRVRVARAHGVSDLWCRPRHHPILSFTLIRRGETAVHPWFTRN